MFPCCKALSRRQINCFFDPYFGVRVEPCALFEKHTDAGLGTGLRKEREGGSALQHISEIRSHVTNDLRTERLENPLLPQSNGESGVVVPVMTQAFRPGR